MEVNYLGSLFRWKEFCMKNDRLMIKQLEMHDAICVTGSLLCLRAWLHTYACSSWQRRPVCLVSVQHINPPLLGGRGHCLFPQLFAQPFSVLTALLLTKTCLLSWLPGTPKSAACWGALLCSQASGDRRPALKRSLTSHRGSWWETKRNSTKAAGSQMTVPCVHLSAVIHKSWLTQPGIHPLCAYMCACVHVSFKEKEGQGQGTVCLFSWRVFHLNWQCWLQYILSFSIPA